ncbi:FAD-binding protein [Cryobacterium melibiosiphilum]|uniref:FAD-binding protein n=1 Tax=Cryobacterium melibiosiphilum TaxID=995039 RepID=A0A3A5MDQ8_9MICO|nr:D-arabinono-1,4-lactone oxidase [Cryobacterium melibiosiphilum]RJT86871.1 FAD-binding protein [Cryobacterium melibiosiphilum]
MTTSGSIWRNWARTEAVRPVRVERPTTPAAVQRAVIAASRAGLLIKAVGSGHSFSGVAVAPGVLLDLHDLGGLLGVDPHTQQATFAAGTPLHRIPALLKPWGLALQNLGDIDRQTVAGSTSTGTHGTGGSFGGLSTRVVALTLVTGDGSLLHVSTTENSDLLPAARIGLGALGVIVDLTVQCVSAFLLHAVEGSEPLDDVLGSYLERTERADHFEFYWFPHTQAALTKTNTRLPPGAERSDHKRLARWFDDGFVANDVYRATCALGSVVPAVVPGINRLAERIIGRHEYTDASHRIFVSPRRVRFREMEYALPRAAVPAAMRELRRLIERSRWMLSFPVEVRSAAADDAWLSGAYGRDTGYIAVHRYWREDPAPFFRDVEAIMLAHDGRPHWAKLHEQTADSLRPMYPHFDDFLRVRDRLDPERRFSNPYLERVLGR